MVQRRWFGTDGLRGPVGKEPFTPTFVVKFAQGLGRWIQYNFPVHPHVVIGKDTRLSGYMVESSLVAGLVAMGVDVTLLGPLPTPAVALLTRSLRASAGIMISASHNPFQDNGIKVFTHNGVKLTDEDERVIEEHMNIPGEESIYAQAHRWGRVTRLEGAAGRYVEYLKGTFPKDLTLDGLKIVIDCANGACYHAAPLVLKELGAQIVVIGANPDGVNINDQCGALHPQILQEAVCAQKAYMGIALDGDGDRLVIVDEQGKLIEAEQIIAYLALSYNKRKGKPSEKVVSTVMASLGFENFLEKHDIGLLRTAVGDRYVDQALRHHKLRLGGEPSGHILIPDLAPAGDGLMAALQLLGCIHEKYNDYPALGNIFPLFQPTPQYILNINMRDIAQAKASLVNTTIANTIESLVKTYKERGARLVVRPSGTEAVVRILVESDDVDSLEVLARHAAETLGFSH